MKLRTIIADDEKLARNGIKLLLKNEKDIEIIEECSDGIETLKSISELKPDLVFLDIQMPELNGFEVISNLKMDALPYFIFITAFDEYALQAFKVHAVDYLLKPVNKELFQSALERAKLLITSKKGIHVKTELLTMIRESEKQNNIIKRLLVKDRGKMFVVNIGDIKWFSSEGDYVKIHTQKEDFLLRERLSHLEQKLDQDAFCRIHRSTIIRISLVKEFEPISKGDYILKTSEGKQFTLSRSYRDSFFATFK